jgi:ribonuclease BN (tRNA processing enzyme)
MPTANRNTLGILVSLCNKANFLFDCGDGSYEQMADHFAADTF